MTSPATVRRMTQARASLQRKLTAAKRDEKAARKRKRDLARRLEALERACERMGITLILTQTEERS